MNTIESAAIPTGTVRKRTSFASQLVTIVAVVVPPLGLLSAIGLLWGMAFHWLDLAVLVGMYVVCAFGTTIGFHRYFTHKGFETSNVVKATLAVLGCMTMQGPLTQWVTDHRKRHALSDEEGDPHSPTSATETASGARSKASCMPTSARSSRSRAWSADATTGRTCTRTGSFARSIACTCVWVVLTFAVPFAFGYVIGGSVARGVEAAVWGGLLRIFLYQRATFAVNSICHMFGQREYRSRDESRNNWVIAVLVFGEGWHNNHHAFPSSARHGLARWQLDVSWWVIRGLERTSARVERPQAVDGADGAPSAGNPLADYGIGSYDRPSTLRRRNVPTKSFAARRCFDRVGSGGRADQIAGGERVPRARRIDGTLDLVRRHVLDDLAATTVAPRAPSVRRTSRRRAIGVGPGRCLRRASRLPRRSA